MNIPNYTQYDLHQDDGGENFQFQEFISEILRMELFENGIEEGICKKILSDGTYGLSTKQLYHVEQVASRHNKECLVCGEKIPLNDVIYLDGDFCSYHKSQMDNDN